MGYLGNALDFGRILDETLDNRMLIPLRWQPDEMKSVEPKVQFFLTTEQYETLGALSFVQHPAETIPEMAIEFCKKARALGMMPEAFILTDDDDKVDDYEVTFNLFVPVDSGEGYVETLAMVSDDGTVQFSLNTGTSVEIYDLGDEECPLDWGRIAEYMWSEMNRYLGEAARKQPHDLVRKLTE